MYCESPVFRECGLLLKGSQNGLGCSDFRDVLWSVLTSIFRLVDFLFEETVFPQVGIAEVELNLLLDVSLQLPLSFPFLLLFTGGLAASCFDIHGAVSNDVTTDEQLHVQIIFKICSFLVTGALLIKTRQDPHIK